MVRKLYLEFFKCQQIVFEKFYMWEILGAIELRSAKLLRVENPRGQIRNAVADHLSGAQIL